MAGASSTKSKSNLSTYIAALMGLAIYAGGTYVVVDLAGGAAVETNDSNTPNGVTVGPPSYK